ncbi:VOC family protein [Candidatus Dependentiae bacterium]|nr:VOC family protein [Candidatus Dependentiae bacterium]
MMKSGELVVVVESVREAVKFYTEKLSFDVVQLDTQEERGEFTIVAARIRKGKCFIYFRTAAIDELAEFSVIKRCSSRCVSLQVELKKGIEKYYAKCNKKGVVVSELKESADKGIKTFAVRDPFGVRVQFIQPDLAFKPQAAANFLGLPFRKQDLSQTSMQNAYMEEMVGKLKKIGVLRRAGKKYARQWLKQQLDQ